MCDSYGRCEFCAHMEDCDYMGTGDPVCSEFQCIAPEEICKKHSTCITYEEEAEMYGYIL